MTKSLAYIGLGTNLGDRWDNLGKAVGMLDEWGPRLRILRCSRIYETEPWGGIEQPAFLNCVIEVRTSLDPEELLTTCKAVEEELGRVPGVRWGPRLIDLDILLYGGVVVDLPHLEIPHPRLHLRAFALIPLEELVPDAIHPSLRASVADLARSVEGRDGVVPVGELGLAVGQDDC